VTAYSDSSLVSFDRVLDHSFKSYNSEFLVQKHLVRSVSIYSNF